MILLIDSYDSFSYNLYQLVGALNPDIQVIRNDEKTVEEIRGHGPQPHPPLSGPRPAGGAGVLMDVVQALGARSPSWGVCLGHQAICAALGGTVTYARQLMHGKQSQVTLDQTCPLFAGCPSRARVARYHSLAVAPASLPACLQVTAATDEGGSDGGAPQGLPHLRPAISPGIHSDPQRQDHAAKLSQGDVTDDSASHCQNREQRGPHL